MKTPDSTKAESSAPNSANFTDDGKHIATLRAKLALAGFVVHATVTGGWLVARWDRSHYCARIEDLEAFCRRVGVHIDG